MSDVLVDAEAMTTAELTATEAYRWLHVCSIDGRRAWRRHFTLGCVRGVRLHAGLDRVCVHLAHKKLCVLRASDGALLGEMDFYGGALLYHRLIVYDLVRVRIMGMYPLPVDQAGMPGGSFSFAVSPVQLALRDARSSLMTSVVFDKPSL
ncbi:hypothetical protein SYNPS1DRAFT_23949 [Syncephalis pseudoplumigaleata]|uniref:Uncharacterized protein n=1 Tax=Syncephalis pseudoplumigaleata TaxID=1712513 RepID=A0A4P9YVA9_9FUNG|nr:hypothetical protein SYNPS1DRAFT_23949 [Syncephalis pseudoplumigaleata]|eukprot:RKP23956.1 hypothetical protein SYNPS1DRAFT_23949 [Syncephalis pseudoplumigaleata]